MAIQRFTITTTTGEEITTTPNLGDSLAFEKAVKNNPHWGDLSDNQIKAGAFRAWHSAKREGKLSCSWEEFADICNNVAAADADHTNPLEVDGLGESAGTTEASYTS